MASESHKEKYDKSIDHVRWKLCCAWWRHW